MVVVSLVVSSARSARELLLSLVVLIVVYPDLPDAHSELFPWVPFDRVERIAVVSGLTVDH